MGLDMYLDARRYVSNFGNDTGLHNKLNELTTSLGYTMEAKEITFRAMYWRKANQIHKWFVDNVQNGVDDCGYYPVSSDQLQQLLIIVNSLLEEKNAKMASSKLPPQSGFFFGNEDINDWYWEDLESTKEGLEKMFAQIGDNYEFDWTVTYHSSW
jgi:hypothetical protein